jgi:hypothetical protein
VSRHMLAPTCSKLPSWRDARCILPLPPVDAWARTHTYTHTHTHQLLPTSPFHLTLVKPDCVALRRASFRAAMLGRRALCCECPAVPPMCRQSPGLVRCWWRQGGTLSSCWRGAWLLLPGCQVCTACPLQAD